MNTRFVKNALISLTESGVQAEFQIPVYPDTLHSKILDELEKTVSRELGLESPAYEISMFYNRLDDNRCKVKAVITTNQPVNKIYTALSQAISNITDLMLEWETLYEFIKMRAAAEKEGGEL